MQEYNLTISVEVPQEHSNDFDNASEYIYSKLSQFNTDSFDGALVHTDGNFLYLSTDCKGDSFSSIVNIIKKELGYYDINVLHVSNEDD